MSLHDVMTPLPSFLVKLSNISRIAYTLSALCALDALCSLVEAVPEAVLKTVPELFSSFSFKSRIVGHFRIMNVSDVSEIVTNIIHDALISMHPEAVPKTNRKIVADVSTNVIPEAVPEVLYKVVVESLI